MNLHLSIDSLKAPTTTFCIQAGFSIAMVLSLAACSALKQKDYSVKDSLYVWSGSLDASTEANSTGDEYQAISLVKENILNSDVQLIFEAMVNNEIAEIDFKLAEINLKLAEMDSKKILPIHEGNEKNELPIEQHETIGAVISNENDIKPETQLVAQIPQEDLESLEYIKRVTQENPTAAGIPLNDVLPSVSAEVSEVELPKEILKLAKSTDQQLAVNEYGMWHLAKKNDSPYQEVCSLSSATMQVEVENYSTQVWLNVVGNKLLVNSTTNIDISQPRVGVQFDNGALQTFSKSHFQTSAVWSGDLESALNNNKQLSISLGGNELGQQTQELSIGLNDLKKAYAEYSKCNRGTQIGSL